jgi:hypothetical protein
MQLPESKLVKNQKFKQMREIGDTRLTVTVRHDDSCGNGHNSFAITADIDEKINGRWRESGGGCCHDEVVRFFPELERFIKWHLCSTDEPMHYVANTIYHASDVKEYHHFVYLNGGGLHKEVLLGLFDDAGLEKIKERYADFILRVKTEPTYRCHDADIDAARRSAIWPNATLEQLRDKDALMARLPALMAEFKADVESLGLTY